MKTSPTSRTLAECRRRGWQSVAVVEHWNAFANIRQDLFGFIDLLAIRQDGSLLGIQACSAASVAARRTKILASEHYVRWASAPDRDVEIWAWSKKGARGKRKKWTLTIWGFSRPAPEKPKST